MRKAFIGALLFALAAATQAATNWVEGQHYFLIRPPQPTNVAPGKVEVIEVFSYGCIACYSFYPTADKLKAALPKNAEMAYVPASWNAAESWPLFQRAYLTAQALGIADRTHNAMFKAIWESDELAVVDQRARRVKNPQPTLEKVAAFYERTGGVKKEEFIKVAKSFSIEVKMKNADNLVKAYRAESTPTLIVNGKYRVRPSDVGGEAQTIELVKWLVARETK